MDYCPNCQRAGISAGRCKGCGSDFRVGAVFYQRVRRANGFSLPTVREATPSRLAKMFRDSAGAEPKGCGLRYKRAKFS